MNKSLFQSTFKNLYASVASADNCVTKSSQAEVSLSSKLLVVQGAYGYGKMVLEENASIEGWVNLSGSDLSSILSAAPAGRRPENIEGGFGAALSPRSLESLVASYRRESAHDPRRS